MEPAKVVISPLKPANRHMLLYIRNRRIITTLISAYGRINCP